MSSEKKYKKDKEILLEWDSKIKDIRLQLSEQCKCVDVRLEAHLAMLWELQDFYKRRAEVELEYSKNLDRMVKQIMIRHKTEKQKRDCWPGYSTYTCWQTLLATTRRQSKDHAILSEIYNNQMCNRLNDLTEDLQRLHRKCREIAGSCHEEITKVLNELQSSMKTYHIYHSESKQAEGKLRYVESQKMKVEQHASKGGTLSRKFRNFEKQTEKKQAKYTENKLKALKARNDYLLCIDSANAAIKKYYCDDLPDIMDCMDLGYHNTLARAMLLHVSGEDNLLKSRQGCIDLMKKCVTDLDQRTDKQRFLELYNQAFSLPKKFEFQAHKGDEVCQISAQKPVQDELLGRLDQLNNRLTDLKLETDEMLKTLDATDKSVMEMINQKDYEVTHLFTEEKQPPKSPHDYMKKRSDRLETEAFYLTKFRDFTLSQNLICRLQAKYNSIQKALGEGNCGVIGSRPPSLPPKPKKRKIGRAPLVGQPRLFGGSIEEYVEVTGQEIPLIVRSCIRILNLYGMHHQGVFRVSGSQHEINEFKNAFERGEDPLVDILAAKDINSVAGVLKLYFRELREPLFPVQLFGQFIDASQLENTQCSIARIKELLSTLPRAIIVVMRYLFAFLNHLSEYSDENMMDPYNLAICFGPTLLPIPTDRDQVHFQGTVNELCKTLITHQEEIFPHDGGAVYEKCILEDERDGEDTLETLSDDEDVGDAESEEEPDLLEAVAHYDFSGRTDRELSFKKTDVLVVYNQVSPDWWEGAFNGKEGLIPDKYISIKSRERDDERSVLSEEDKRRSTESLPAKAVGLSSLSTDGLDKSASQPNIAVTTDPPSDLGPAPPPSADSKSTSSSAPEKKPDKLDKPESGDSGVSETSSQGPDAERTAEDLAQDIDSALAEVMSGLHSLQMRQSSAKLKLQKPPAGNPKHTPDLVLDLPISTGPASPKHLSNPDSPTLSTAEVFANSNLCTIKKGSTIGAPKSSSNVSTFQKQTPGTGLAVEEDDILLRTYNSSSKRAAKKEAPKVRTQRYSDPSDDVRQDNTSLPGNMPRSQTLPNRPIAPDHRIVIPEIRGATPERSPTPEKPLTYPRPALPNLDAYAGIKRAPPGIKPKPSIKVKPPVMKKPTKSSPEVFRKMRETTPEPSSNKSGTPPP